MVGQLDNSFLGHVYGQRICSLNMKKCSEWSFLGNSVKLYGLPTIYQIVVLSVLMDSFFPCSS